jgi:3-oxoacyl-(acyl-carrier-protein) synthase
MSPSSSPLWRTYRRVVCTGLGLKSCLSFDDLLIGKSGIQFSKKFNHLVAPIDENSIKYGRRTSRFVHFALEATNSALLDSGLSNNNLSDELKLRTV